MVALLALGCAARAPRVTDAVVVHPVEIPPAVTLVLVCDGLTFTAHVQGETAWLFLPGRTVALPHVPSASGAKYADRGIVFWSKGEEAMLDVRDASYRSCRNDPRRAVWEHAKLRGVAFRAVGNEPGWYLEIEDDKEMLFVTDYGETRVTTPAPAPLLEAASSRATYRATNGSNELVVVIDGEPCSDDMSGEPFPSTVVVELNGRRHQGCGRSMW